MLLIDAGNTRLKWAVLGESGLGPQQAEVYADLNAAQLHARVLTPLGRIERVIVANVGGERVASLIRAALQVAAAPAAEFVQPERRLAGIVNGYDDPLQLGVDRWAAMIGARAVERRPMCIVSVGTAMTIDGVDASGAHLGGVIVPGPDLMVTSLKRGTSEIAARSLAGSVGVGLFADNTLGGIQQGALHALAALVHEASQVMLARAGAVPALLLTGGAAHHVAPLLKFEARVVPDLVLRGLAVIAGLNGPV